MDSFRHDASVETWLFTIAANVWRNEVRSRTASKREGREVPLEGLAESPGALSTELHEADDPLAGLLEEERAGLLREALDELPAQMRRCLLLRLDQELKYREIAQVLQVSIETVKSQLFQARERLRQRLVS
jgi:RNA polymerase sigma-70 factor (ECF subfamily)